MHEMGGKSKQFTGDYAFLFSNTTVANSTCIIAPDRPVATASPGRAWRERALQRG